MSYQCDFFSTLRVKSNITQKILDKVKSEPESSWVTILDLSLCQLHIDDFAEDPEMVKVINHFKLADKLVVFRFEPNVCFKWHKDNSRCTAINMLLEGFDSFCAFGTPDINNSYSNIRKLVHEPNVYYILDVTKHHMVFNFSQKRYMLSMSMSDIPYPIALKYLREQNLLT
jgi:uncharacterized protein (DUF4213/DUF364 family)